MEEVLYSINCRYVFNYSSKTGKIHRVVSKVPKKLNKNEDEVNYFMGK